MHIPLWAPSGAVRISCLFPFCSQYTEAGFGIPASGWVDAQAVSEDQDNRESNDPCHSFLPLSSTYWKLYFFLISHDFTQVRITPKMTANLNEVSQSTAPSPCPIRLQRNVTIAVIRKVMVNTVKNLTDSFFFVVNRKSLFIFPDFYCPCGRWYWFTLPAGYWTMYMTQKYWWTIWCALWCCFERLIGTSWVLKLWSKIIAKLPFYVLVLHACVHRVQRGLRWHDPSFSCLPCD